MDSSTSVFGRSTGGLLRIFVFMSCGEEVAEVWDVSVEIEGVFMGMVGQPCHAHRREFCICLFTLSLSGFICSIYCLQILSESPLGLVFPKPSKSMQQRNAQLKRPMRSIHACCANLGFHLCSYPVWVSTGLLLRTSK